ncbi:uncharacterized protein EI90DRAFT_3075664 [Cantharellus anzutake]|uniref:uncharacterized protein n=1 Tax=Cantharellus anzutake TaxID=1750568 RepID=UPI0019033EFA|nr:uncharacterized protein EI90DRAFT_3075664 [Cantharellus anzutake]KAF8324280.1 hypothetical protein EI90DRAFT_3075664 [Cantharellus anzutake]
MAFQFDFNLEEVSDSISTPSGQPIHCATQIEDSMNLLSDSNTGQYCELLLKDLLSQIPETISYTPLQLHTNPPIIIPRRDLFDVRFQLISQTDPDSLEDSIEPDPRLAYIEAPSDLMPGAYEGGLKTWECSLDLASYLADSRPFGAWTESHKILEIGCGTAVPTMFLFLDLLNSRYSSGCSSFAEVHFHLQDYNSFTMQLVTVPNLLLVWYLSDASEAFRKLNHAAQRAESSRSDSGVDECPEEQLEIEITPNLVDAFLNTLRIFNVSIRLFAGSWEALCIAPGSPLVDASPYTIVLTSETVYRIDSLDSLLRVLQMSSSTAKPSKDVKVPDTLCLVAAKIVYFGVGGGVSEFVRRASELSVANADGNKKPRVETVWEQREGVARAVLRLHWG